MAFLFSLGLRHLILPILFWAPVFFFVALTVNIFVVRLCRKRLRAAGASTLAPTLLLVLLLNIGAPIAAGVFGGSFAVARALGGLLDGSALLDRARELGEARARALLRVRSDGDLVNLKFARETIAARLHDDRGSIHFSLSALPTLLEDAWLAELDLAAHSFPLHHEISFGDLAARARLPVDWAARPAGRLLSPLADRCFAAARNTLLMIVLLLGALDGAALGIVYAAARPTRKAATSA